MSESPEVRKFVAESNPNPDCIANTVTTCPIVMRLLSAIDEVSLPGFECKNQRVLAPLGTLKRRAPSY